MTAIIIWDTATGPMGQYKPGRADAGTYHGDAVVEQRFAEDNDVEQLIDVDRLEDSEYGDWIDSGQ